MFYQEHYNNKQYNNKVVEVIPITQLQKETQKLKIKTFGSSEERWKAVCTDHQW